MTHAIPYEPDELDRAAEAAYVVANTHLNGRPPVVDYAHTCAETKEIWRKVAAAVLDKKPAFWQPCPEDKYFKVVHDV